MLSVPRSEKPYATCIGVQAEAQVKHILDDVTELVCTFPKEPGADDIGAYIFLNSLLT